MFKNAIFFAFLTITSAYAQSIEEIVENTLNNNYDLKSIQNSIFIAKEQIKISQNWKNPTLTLGANDIQSSNLFARDLEPMQAIYIGLSQIVPIGDKQKLKKDLSLKQKDIEQFLLKDKKLQLKAKIYEYSYTILVLEKKYILLNQYEKNLNSLLKLLNALYGNTQVTQNSILNTDIKIVKLKLKKENLKNTIKTLYLKLEELSFSKISKIDASLNMKTKELKKDFDNHPKIMMLVKSIDKSRLSSKLEEAKKTSDIKVNISYFSRDKKYKDYVNFSLNIPLSVYGTESIKVLKAKIKTKKIKDNLKTLKQKFKISLDILQENINTTYLTYNLLKKTIIPLKNKVQENLETYNSFNQIKPQDNIKNLNEIISYKLQALDEMNKYFSFMSKSIYFTQGL